MSLKCDVIPLSIDPIESNYGHHLFKIDKGTVSAVLGGDLTDITLMTKYILDRVAVSCEVTDITALLEDETYYYLLVPKFSLVCLSVEHMHFKLYVVDGKLTNADDTCGSSLQILTGQELKTKVVKPRPYNPINKKLSFMERFKKLIRG